MNNKLIVNNNESVLPAGFRAVGIHAGLKDAGREDMALIVSDVPAVIGGVFTTNRIAAAPVKLCRKHLASRSGVAIIMNSKCANACTGAQGQLDAAAMATYTAEQLHVSEEDVFVCSTGHIGDLLPMDLIRAGIEKAVAELDTGSTDTVARAMMTTDTTPKSCSVHCDIDGREITICGVAKGSGMIEPNMATMLAFILTDAAVAPDALQRLLKESVDTSFNRITVDGDRSTNDSVLCMANGMAGNQLLDENHPEWGIFAAALAEVAFSLAMKIIRDGEGAKKVVTIAVNGAASQQDAEIAARAVANSLLVKTSWVRDDVNWGRVIDAIGYSGAEVCEERVSINYNDLPAVINGCAADTAPQMLRDIVLADAFTITINLGLGNGDAVVYSCDCTEEYVRINY